MATIKKRAEPMSDSDSDLDTEPARKTDRNIVNKRPGRQRNMVGGLIVRSESMAGNSADNTSLSAAEKKGLKEVADLERELDLKNTFSRETNKRDEDAEMNKYINEKIREKRELDKKRRMDETPRDSERDPGLFDVLSMSAHGSGKIDDILLESLSDNTTNRHDEKSEAMLSSQMLNGVPEVDLSQYDDSSDTIKFVDRETIFRRQRDFSNKSRFNRPRR